MSTSAHPPRDTSYKGAVAALLTLVSNAQAIAQRKSANAYKKNAWEMSRYASRVGLTDEVLNNLGIIHVTGTKGKGSTCAFCERILRDNGVKTGLFSSPHLMEPRERIRIGGAPISEELFASTFWKVWDMLEEGHTEEDGLESHPMFFRYLTLMGLKVFAEEKVDAVLLEVGIGGEYDSTNFIPPPVVSAISSVGYDHVDLLGKTLTSIGRQKAGILKPGTVGVTVDQEDEAMAALVQRAKERKGTLYSAPALKEYGLSKEDIVLGIQGEHQYENARLAVGAALAWLERMGRSTAFCLPADAGVLKDESDEPPAKKAKADQPPRLPLQNLTKAPKIFLSSLASTRWPGRTQTVPDPAMPNINFRIDGAHTYESVRACAKWYSQVVSTAPPACKRVLIFSSRPGRQPMYLMLPVADHHARMPFDTVIFCSTNATEAAAGGTADQQAHADQWVTLCTDATALEKVDFPSGIRNLAMEEARVLPVSSAGEVRVAATFADALQQVRDIAADGRPVEVLSTGSLYLAGAALEVLGVGPQ